MDVERIRRQVPRIALGVAVLVFFLMNTMDWPVSWRFIDQMESLAYDARLAFSSRAEPDHRIVIVDIDERSLTAEGRWPWPRYKVARMVEQLFDTYKVGLVGFDVVFAEPDESSGIRVLEGLAANELAGVAEFKPALDSVRKRLDYDRIFADTLAKYPVVLGYYFNVAGPDGKAQKIGKLPPPILVAGAFAGKNIDFHRRQGYGGNLAILQDNALTAGHFEPEIDSDGIVRRVPMLVEYDGAYYESLSLAVARLALQAKEVLPKYAPNTWGSRRNYSGFEWLQVGDRAIPIDERVQALVPYRGPQGSFPYVSATDILQGRADPAVLKGTIVLVGTSAPGLNDLRATPIAKVFAGVEIHANLIAGIIDGSIKEKPHYTIGAEFVLLTVVGLLMALVLPFLGPMAATLSTLAVLAVSVGLNLVVWSQGNLVLPIASGLMMIGLMFLLNMSYGFFFEARGKQKLASKFGQYVPPELVDEMSRDPEAYTKAAESRELTVLFSDVRGFTTISEGLTPTALSDLMKAYLTPMTRVIHDNRGTIDKYMGDAIMAFWGAPLPDPEHARHAVQSALEMLRRLEALNAEFRERGWPDLHIGIGINTGDMSVGDMGSEFRQAYTVMGDAVNLGSRLEGQTKTYGVPIIVSETTRAKVPEYAYRELDRIRVKGKDEPVTIYEPLGPAESVTKAMKDELSLYRQALKYYRAQDWDHAELQFLNLQRSSSAPALYRMYADRIAEFRVHPPGKSWDGVYTHKTK